MAIFEDETSSSRRLNREDYEVLRNHFDGDDNVFHGISVIAPRNLQPHYRAEKDDPASQFLYNDEGTRKFLLKTFPRLQTDENQKSQAGRWAVVISYYFRQGLPDSTIEYDLGWNAGTVGSIVQQIRRRIKGLRRNGKPYSTRKRGRPRKVVVTPVEAVNFACDREIAA